MRDFFRRFCIICLFVTAFLYTGVFLDAEIITLKDKSELYLEQIVEANSEGLLGRADEYKPLSLYRWQELDIHLLERQNPEIFKAHDKVRNGDTVSFEDEVDTESLSGFLRQIKEDSQKRKVERFKLVGINDRTVFVDGICEAMPEGLLVEPNYGDEGILTPWRYINLDKLRDDLPKVHEAYLSCRSGNKKAQLFLGSCAPTAKSKSNFRFAKSSGLTFLENCRLVSHGSNDGDSYRIIHKGKQYHVRLYFVDTSETNMSFPKRVHRQAEYFNTNVDKAMEYARLASSFAKKTLGKGSFHVFTKFEDAMGGQSIGRIYGFVLCPDGEFMSEKLVRLGLARIFGMPATIPSGKSASYWRAHLKKLENEAKLKKIGTWKK